MAKNVWIIDDTEQVANVLSSFCEKIGCKTRTFPSGDEALGLLTQGEKPDGITSDMINYEGGMHGDEFYDRAMPYLANAAKLLLTGIPSEVRLGKYPSLKGSVRILQKPVTMEKFTRNLGYRMGLQTDVAWVVEDSEKDAAALKAALEEDGYATRVFQTHQQALDMIAKNTEIPVVVVTDYLNLGGMNGVEFFRNAKLGNPKRIVLSSFFDAKSVARISAPPEGVIVEGKARALYGDGLVRCIDGMAEI